MDGKLYTDEQIKEILSLVESQEGEQIAIVPEDNWSGSDGLNRLYGVTITDIRIGESQHTGYFQDVYKIETLTFVTDKGLISFDGEADCCSETWFADFFNIPDVLNSKVISVEVIDLEVGDYNVEKDNRTRQECDEVYGYRIRTEKGSGVFSLRNSSNGWYGGSIGKCDSHVVDPSTSIINQTNWMAENE